jgi:hypothetical protein
MVILCGRSDLRRVPAHRRTQRRDCDLRILEAESIAAQRIPFVRRSVTTPLAFTAA